MPAIKTYPQFIQYPDSWTKELVLTNVAADFIDPGNKTLRIENMTVTNNHIAAVAVELLHHDGTAGRVIWSTTLDAGESLDVMQDRFVQRNKQFVILNTGHKYQVRVTTAVAGAVVWEASGGLFN